MAKLTESYLRSMIKQVMNESMDETDNINQLIKAMNQIRTEYAGMQLGSSVPEYYVQGGDTSFDIKDFINDNVSVQVTDDYLNKLTQLLSQKGLKVQFIRDYDEISNIMITNSTPTHSSSSTEIEQLKNKIAEQDEYYDYELEGMFVDNLVDELGASRDDIANALKSYTSEGGKKYTVEGEDDDMRIIIQQLSESRKRKLAPKRK
jgi:hypothetical protein